ncbi:hypothetical protein H0R92_02075 [Treponema sp. OMZ 840]|uniref:hypothetical protein n=1 Tax=Treponema sp. OMZ 840 TaxID=244313 RepID=UPI003D8EFD19
MIKKLFLLFFAVICLCSCMNCLCVPRCTYDTYVGQNIDELIKKIGAPYLDEYKTIPKDISGYEMEPDFNAYFTKEELDGGVTVRHIVWKFTYSTLQVWSKNENDIGVVFYSIEYGKCVTF